MTRKSTSRSRRRTQPNASATDLLKLMSELISLRERVAQAELEVHAREILSRVSPNDLHIKPNQRDISIAGCSLG